MPVTILHSKDGKIDAADVAAFNSLKTRLAASPQSKVLLHIHGGLVDQASGEAVAQRLSGQGPSSFQAPPAYEQIYIVWRTGALETIRINWMDLFQNDNLYMALFKRILGYISKRLPSADMPGRSASVAVGLSPMEIERRLKSSNDAPFADLDAAVARDEGSRAVTSLVASENDVKSELGMIISLDPEVTAAVEDIAAAIQWDEGRSGVAPHGNAARGRQSLIRLDQPTRNSWQGTHDLAEGRGILGSLGLLKSIVTHAVAIAWRVIQRFRSGRDHGVHATVVEELVRELYADKVGAALWGMMKKDAYDHFDPGGLGLDLLGALGGATQLVITGHSAGSIWATAMLEKMPGRNLAPVTLLLLAPAVRMLEFSTAIAASRAAIGRFRIFTMRDELERCDPVLGKGTGVIYPSSLLYVVSGLCEESTGSPLPDAAILGMQRFLDHEETWLDIATEISAAKSIRAYVSAIPNAVVYAKAFGGPGLQTDATSHGDFDNNALTLESVRTFL